MATGKLNARQKMINMMYLVLIALLALNVSKEIIKTFNVLENSLDKSNFSILNKSDKLRKAIFQKAQKDNNKAAEAYKLAEEVKKTAENFYQSIEKIKIELEKRANGRDKNAPNALGKSELKEGDNIEKHAHFFIGEKNGEKVEKLTNKTRVDLINALYKAKGNEILNPDHKNDDLFNSKIKEIESKSTLVAEAVKNSEGKKVSWTSMFLENAPLAGVMTILSKIQNDCRNLESEVTQALAESVDANDISVDSVNAVIAAPTSAILTGQTYEADLFLSAYNSQADMTVMVNGQPVEVRDGKGKLKITGTAPGEYSYNVSMNMPGMDKAVTTTGKYSVFSPMASVSCDELQIFYAGLENPITISAAGVLPDNVIPTINVGTLKKVGNGKYHVLIPNRTSNDCVITLNARMEDGRVVSMGTQKFRIRNVPAPYPRIGTLDVSRPVSIAALRVQGHLALSNPEFPYQSVRYQVNSFKFSILSGRFGSKSKNIVGSSLANVKDYLDLVKPGDFIVIENIFYQSPSGIKPLGAVTVSLIP